MTGETGSASRSPPDPTAERAKGGVGLEEGGEEVTGEMGAGLSLQVTTRPHCGEGKHGVRQDGHIYIYVTINRFFKQLRLSQEMAEIITNHRTVVLD